MDNVCLQGTPYHLVSGPENPLRLFTPSFVGSLATDQLEVIAGEKSVSIQRRRELVREIESLRKSFGDVTVLRCLGRKNYITLVEEFQICAAPLRAVWEKGRFESQSGVS